LKINEPGYPENMFCRHMRRFTEYPWREIWIPRLISWNR